MAINKKDWIEKPGDALCGFIFSWYLLLINKTKHLAKGLFILLLSILLSLPSGAQGLPELQFTHIGTSDGLSSPYIRYIYQDSRGLLWICTTDGLNRYDGGSFKVFKNIPNNSNSLPSDDIWMIEEDRKGNFWVGTQNGLCYFEPNENRFTSYLHEAANKNSLAYTRAENIIIDDSGFLWVGSLNGLQRFNPATKEFRLIQFATKEELAKNTNLQSVYQLYIDNKKQLWVNAAGQLYLMNRGNLSYKKMVERFPDGGGVTSIYQDSRQQYWLSYWGHGFAKFDGVHPPAEKDFIASTSICSRLAEWKDMHNNTWLVITADEGIYFYNMLTDELKIFQHDNTKPNSFSSHGSGYVLTDKNNNVWIMATKGLELLEPSKQFFQYHWLGEKKDREDYYLFGIPQPVHKYDNYYWAGLWHAKGLIKMDSNWHIIKHYKTIPENSAANGNKTVYGIYKDVNKIFWISTDHCIERFDETKNSFASFIPTDVHPDEFEFRGVKPLGANKLLIRTRHNGIYIFNTNSLQFEKHISISNTKNFASDDVNDLVYDKQGTLWVITKNGVCSLDTASFTVKEIFTAGKPGSNSLPANDCWSGAVDANNNLWITTQAGLCKLDIAKKTFTTYTTANGLANNSLAKIVVDKNNNCWITSSNGVSYFQTSTNTIRNFYKEDGLPQNNLEGTINQDENGTLYFGDAGIVLTVDPDDIPFNKTMPAVIITDALLEGNHYAIKKNDANEKLLQTISGSSSFTINFAVLNFNSPKLNRYYYKLEGIDNNWHESDRGIASYINVPPGAYILKVKGSNNSGIMNEQGDFMHIIVHPRWYQTWWFKMLAALLAGFIIFYFVKRRIKNIRREAELKQQVTETKMQALRAQMNPHFIFNSLNSIENFIMQNEKRLASDYLNKFARLIRMILDSSRNEIVPLSKDMEALQLYIDLEQLRFNNKFSCKMDIDPVLLNGDYRVPSLLIQPYVENAIVHGLAHSEKTGGTVSVTATLEGNDIKYTIEDNGIGRKQAGEYNAQNKPYHKSVGLDITEARIKNFNKNSSGRNAVKITDLYDSDNKPAGTKVEIIFNAM